MKSFASGARGWFSAVAMFSVVAAAAAACAGTGERAPSAGPTGSTTTSTSVAPTPTPTVASEAEKFGPASLVKGQASCFISFGDTTTSGDGTIHARDGSVVCKFMMNDPRVTGESKETWLGDMWAGEQDRRILIQWGSTVLKTAGGTWKGTYSGSWDGSEDYISYWLRGSGAYTGLTFHAWLVTGQAIPQGEAVWNRLVEGIIYPGDPPKAAVPSR